MLIKRPADIRPSEITDESIYLNRREFLRAAGLTIAGITLGTAGPSSGWAAGYDDLVKSPFSTDEPPNSWEDITTYNNFYEFGVGKSDPARNARDFQPLPWEIAIGGECDNPRTLSYEDLVKPYAFEERIYRLRCVEAWSMVVPWVGIPLADILKRFEPNSRARFVRFTTLFDPKRMPGQKRRTLDWPYVEGLTIEEAMNPLTLMAVGVYGRELPAQNGAPLRLVVPWKYGFKSIKSIVRIDFTETRPTNTWSAEIPDEYGFYANVNPNVDHPRWSQAKERRIGNSAFAPKQPTQMFNGYGEQVAHLYKGLDLARNF